MPQATLIRFPILGLALAALGFLSLGFGSAPAACDLLPVGAPLLRSTGKILRFGGWRQDHAPHLRPSS